MGTSRLHKCALGQCLLLSMTHWEVRNTLLPSTFWGCGCMCARVYALCICPRVCACAPVYGFSLYSWYPWPVCSNWEQLVKILLTEGRSISCLLLMFFIVFIYFFVCLLLLRFSQLINTNINNNTNTNTNLYHEQRLSKGMIGRPRAQMRRA